MQDSAIKRLAHAIGYPGEVGALAVSYTLMVDDMPIKAVVDSGRLLLIAELEAEPTEEISRTLAGYALGRALKENAMLSSEPSTGSLILWQGVIDNISSLALREFFTQFTASLDWWRERVSELKNPKPEFPEVLIRP